MATRLPEPRCARRKPSGSGLWLVIGMLCALGFAPAASAATIASSWLLAADGDWDTAPATQWSTNPDFPNNDSPAAGDIWDVTIDAVGSPYTVTLDTDISINSLILDSSDATLSHTAGTFSVTGSADLVNGSYAASDTTIDGGTWNISGGTLFFAGANAHMDNAIVNVNASGARFGATGAGTLTLTGSTVNLNVTSARITGNGTVINQGSIDADGGGSALFVDIDPDFFVNEGTVTVSNSATLDLANSWDNSNGTIALGDNGSVRLQGSYTTAGIGMITRTGSTVVQLQGTLDNSGETLALNSSTGSYLLNGGTIQNGTVDQDEDDGKTLIIAGSASNRLVGTTVNGGLDLTGFNSQLRLANGASFDGGTATLGTSAKLGVEGTETLDNAIVELSGSNSRLGVAGDGTLTLGPNLSTNLTGSSSALGSDVILAGVGTVVNQGAVTASGGGAAAINPDVFTNQGTVEATGGSTLTVGCASCSVTNLAGGVLTGGSWRAIGASSLELFGDPLITTNRASVLLSGADSSFDSIESLTLNDSAGNLRLLDSRNFDVAAPFTNRGNLQLGGGTFTATSFDNDGGTITGSGTIGSAVGSAGTLAPGASAGRLDIDGNLTLLSGSVLDLELGGTDACTGFVCDYDFIDVMGTAILDGNLWLSFIAGFENTVDPSDEFTLLDSDADLTGFFANVLSGETLNVSGGPGSFEIFYGVGSDFGAAKVVATNFLVPEPSTGLLLAAGLTGLAAGRRRRAR